MAKIVTIAIINQIEASSNVQNTSPPPIYFMIFKQWLEIKLNEADDPALLQVNQALKALSQSVNGITDQNLRKQMMDTYMPFAKQIGQIIQQQPQQPAAPPQQPQPAQQPVVQQVQAPQMPQTPQPTA